MKVKVKHLETTTGAPKKRRWPKIVGWVVGGLSFVYFGLGWLVNVAFWSSGYHLSQSMAVAAAVTNAIAPALAYKNNPHVEPSFQWPPRGDGLCEAIINGQSVTWDKRRLGKISGKCRLASARRANEVCSYWWVGRDCIAISVPAEIFSNGLIRQRLSEAVRNPCGFIPDVEDMSPPGKQFNYPSVLRKILGCETRSGQQQFDTFVIIEEDGGERVEYFASNRSFFAKYFNINFF